MKDARYQITRCPRQQVIIVERCDDVQSSVEQLTLVYAQRKRPHFGIGN